MTEQATFGDFIREARIRADMGLREAARVLGISASYLSRIEVGEFKPPSGPLLLRMAAAFRIDKNELIVRARDREGEMMTADTGVSSAVQAFYRLAHDQTPEMQEKMLEAAINALDLPSEKKVELAAQLRIVLSRAQRQEMLRLSQHRLEMFASDIKPRCLSRGHLRKTASDVLARAFGNEIPIPVPIESIVGKSGADIVLVIHDELEGGRLDDGSPAVLGLSRWSIDGRRRELVVHEELFDSDETRARRRGNFTMAHELFHCIEHLPLVEDRTGRSALARKVGHITFGQQCAATTWTERKGLSKRLSTPEDWREWQANAFAAELLMPADAVREAFEDLIGAACMFADDRGLRKCADEVARMVAFDEYGEPTTLVDRFDVNPKSMAIRLLDLGLIVDEVQC